MKTHLFCSSTFYNEEPNSSEKKKSSAHRISHIVCNKQENQNQFGILKEEIQIQL